MSATVTNSITNTDKLNYINIGLMLISCLVAFFVPFELFLFSYAVLGPAHYLTEISWLHERNYFSKGKYDYVFLGLAGLILFVILYTGKMFPSVTIFDKDPVSKQFWSTGLVYLSFVAAIAMAFLKNTFQRFIAFIVICASVVFAKNSAVVLLFSVFIPTLIHVYIFTGLFMLYGALKGRSKSGYLSVVIFALCPLLFVFITPQIAMLSDYAIEHYQMFQVVNLKTIELFNVDIFNQYETSSEVVYGSTTGITVMRFIAFAYTYHYLNWFSKTTVIKWHNVPKKRLVVIAVLWLAAVAFYYYKYEIGFHVLFLLSFLHVFLEFPLNHVTFVGIFQEARSILSGKPVPVTNKNKKK